MINLKNKIAKALGYKIKSDQLEFDFNKNVNNRQLEFNFHFDYKKKVDEKMWSILILSLESRKMDFDYIYNRINYQIKKEKLEKDVEILYFIDNKEYTVGHKRNELLKRSKSKYISFVDDDDDVSDNYVKFIYDKLKEGKDCVSLNGVITFDGIDPKIFKHSIIYDRYSEDDHVYYRPPNHLNPIKRKLVENIKFPNQNLSEDTDWALQILNKKLLKSESKLDEIMYFYKFSRKTTEAQK